MARGMCPPLHEIDLTLQQTGRMGDPIFDQYYASNVQFQANTVAQETKMQAAGAALLDKIGPAVLISHSQGGLMPWVIADVRPNLVKAIVSIEPTGPPFIDAVFSSGATRPYGLTDIPLTYSPAPTNTTAPLQTALVANDAAGLANCTVQAEPARQLVNFKNIPVLHCCLRPARRAITPCTMTAPSSFWCRRGCQRNG